MQLYIYRCISLKKHARSAMAMQVRMESKLENKELSRVLCMQGGEDDDGSYAKNSEVPASAIDVSKPAIFEAIDAMELFPGKASIRVADLGCATGDNTIATMEMIVGRLRGRYERERLPAPEFEAFFSDLPSNDFNALFRRLASSSPAESAHYFAAGVPGSFYGRLFANGKLHLAVSMNALHWISRVPEAALDTRSPAWNGGRAWIDGAPEGVAEAFARRSAEDMEAFLRCRKEEMVEGGVLFVLMGGRGSSGDGPADQLEDPVTKAKHPFTAMDQAWQDLVNEGLIEEEARDKFNIPAYMRCPEEVMEAFERCGGFEVRRLEFHRIAEPHRPEKAAEWSEDPRSYGRFKKNFAKAGLKPMIEAHIGADLCEELFTRYENNVISGDGDMLRATCFYGVILVSAIRK